MTIQNNVVIALRKRVEALTSENERLTEDRDAWKKRAEEETAWREQLLELSLDQQLEIERLKGLRP